MTADRENERRERYAAAMHTARRNSGTGAVLAFDRMADAAMAVADAEHGEKVAHSDRIATALAVAEQDNARLRADLSAARVLLAQERRGNAVACEDNARMRVRTVLGSEEARMIDPEKARVRTSAIRAALKGES